MSVLDRYSSGQHCVLNLSVKIAYSISFQTNLDSSECGSDADTEKASRISANKMQIRTISICS
jgi:hypothetical protein